MGELPSGSNDGVCVCGGGGEKQRKMRGENGASLPVGLDRRAVRLFAEDGASCSVNGYGEEEKTAVGDVVMRLPLSPSYSCIMVDSRDNSYWSPCGSPGAEW